jgi:outer membrane protein assembly factor BamB
VAFDPASGNVLWKHPTPGYVIAPLAAAGEVLAVESSEPNGKGSTLEILDQRTGAALKSSRAGISTFGGPTIGRGLVVWRDASGHTQVFEAPAYR